MPKNISSNSELLNLCHELDCSFIFGTVSLSGGSLSSLYPLSISISLCPTYHCLSSSIGYCPNLCWSPVAMIPVCVCCHASWVRSLIVAGFSNDSVDGLSCLAYSVGEWPVRISICMCWTTDARSVRLPAAIMTLVDRYAVSWWFENDAVMTLMIGNLFLRKPRTICRSHAASMKRLYFCTVLLVI